MDSGLRALQAFPAADIGLLRCPWCTPHHSAPALHRPYDRFTHFRVGEVTLDEASAIGSVSLSMTDLLAGPLGIGSPLTPGFNGFC